MKIIICGAGEVGSLLASNLHLEHDITVIDPDPEKLHNLCANCDIYQIEGPCAAPESLKEANAFEADAIISVSPSDEVNILACQIADRMFKVPLKIARVRNRYYYSSKDELFNKENINIDYVISPEELIRQDLLNLIEYPGAIQICHFDNNTSLVGLKTTINGKMLNRSVAEIIKDLASDIVAYPMRILGIYRNNKPIHFDSETIILPDDEVYFYCYTNDIHKIMPVFREPVEDVKNIMIVGGGINGMGLAEIIEKKHHIKIIEKDAKRAKFLAERLKSSLVLQGDVADQNLLFEENIDKVDLFIALSNSDEINIMSSLLAKKLGAKKTISLLQKISYINLIKGSEIDIYMSPQQKTISTVTRIIKAKAQVVKLDFAHNSEAVCLEICVTEKSPIIGTLLCKLNLPYGSVVGAILRQTNVLFYQDELQIIKGDRLLIFSYDKNCLKQLESLCNYQ